MCGRPWDGGHAKCRPAAPKIKMLSSLLTQLISPDAESTALESLWRSYVQGEGKEKKKERERERERERQSG